MVDPTEELKRKARVERAKEDLAFFRRNYVQGPDGSLFDGGPHHERMDELYLNEQYTTFLAPVGFSKSTWMLATILWEIVRNRNIHIIYASHSYSVASDMMTAVQWNLTQNEKLIEDFGEFHDSDNTWKGDRIHVIGNENPRVPTFMITGAEGRVENVRVERIFADDAVNLDSATSEAERESLKDWYFTEFFNRLNIEGKACNIGSRFHPFDLYNEFMQKETWTVETFKAVQDWEEGESLWPERWPFDELQERRQTIGSSIFEARYQQNPEALHGEYFSQDQFNLVTRDQIKDIQVLYQGWDFNLSEDSQADYTVGVTLGVDSDGNWYVIDVFRQHLKSNHVRHMVEFYRKWTAASEYNRWNAEIAGVMTESNLFQSLISTELKKRDAHVPAYPIERHKDKLVRVLRIQPIFEDNRVHFANDIDNLQELMGELLAFPAEGSGHKDDFVDALEIAMSPYVNQTMGSVAKVIGGLDAATGELEPSSNAPSAPQEEQPTANAQQVRDNQDRSGFSWSV